ncbi:Uncharacterised protein [Klebsiella pneumoniae]|nr:Uncharacterised protein [Klebsiella pneumoniae]SSH65877.1 Uncharacterised protein [Klebsiella pneumoniae]SVR48085.1 Uncharacterised protein [Klebsiella pneumoniae]VGP45886.1 hypothetical protein SB00610_02284 [Klebsiella quasipneumoniae subsp. similipneumoniae]
MLLVSRYNNTHLISVLNHISGPAEETFPVISTRLLKNILPVPPGDHVDTFPGLFILRFMVEGYDI